MAWPGATTWWSDRGGAGSGSPVKRKDGDGWLRTVGQRRTACSAMATGKPIGSHLQRHKRSQGTCAHITAGKQDANAIVWGQSQSQPGRATDRRLQFASATTVLSAQLCTQLWCPATAATFPCYLCYAALALGGPCWAHKTQPLRAGRTRMLRQVGTAGVKRRPQPTTLLGANPMGTGSPNLLELAHICLQEMRRPCSRDIGAGVR